MIGAGLLLITLSQQVAYMPVGQTRIMVQVPTIVLSAGVVAESDLAKGKLAYDKCMTSGNALVCEPVRQAAMRLDAEQRWFDAVHEMYSRAPSPNDTTLRNKKLILLQKPTP